MKKKKSQGVSTILILGVIAVLVTIVVPLISRTVVDVRISKQQEEQARAFSIAETGLEKAMIADFGGADSLAETVGDIDYTVTRSGRGGSDFFMYPKAIEKDFPITVWMIEHQGSDFDSQASLALSPIGDRYHAGTISLYWGEPGTSALDDDCSDGSCTPALEATLFYQDASGATKVERYPFDPHAARRAGNNFEAPGVGPYTVHAEEFQFGIVNLSVPCSGANICYALRLKLLYSPTNHRTAVEGSDDFPRQGECYQSTATVQTSGITNRQQRCLFYKDFPSIFDFVLYSRLDLQKVVP